MKCLVGIITAGFIGSSFGCVNKYQSISENLMEQKKVFYDEVERDILEDNLQGPPYIGSEHIIEEMPSNERLKPNRGCDPGKLIPSRILLTTDYNKSIGA